MGKGDRIQSKYGQKKREAPAQGLLVKRAETDESKTYHLPAGHRRWHYVPIGFMAAVYIFQMINVVAVGYDPTGILFVQIVLLMFLVFGYMFVRRSRTRISFYESHLLYYGADVSLFTYRIPWNTVQEIVVEYVPLCKAVLYHTNTKNRHSRVEIPLFHFHNVREIIEQFIETAKKKGIHLREE